MDIDDLVARLAETLHPHPYETRMSVFERPLKLLLLQQQPKSRYAVAVVPWGECPGPWAILGTARARVTEALDATWWRACGLQLVVIGPEVVWRPHVDEMQPDLTGLHGVVIQGIHLIDPDTGVRVLNRTRWGPIRYGRPEPVVAALGKIVPPPSASHAIPPDPITSS